MSNINASTDPLRAITRFIVVHNPHSTRAEEAGSQIRRLQALYKDTPQQLTVIKTVSAAIAPNRDLLQATLQDPEHEALIVLGGDGTWNLVCAALIDPPMSASARKVLLIKFPGGNADDNFRSLHARRWYRDPLSILGHPAAARQVISLHPFTFTESHNGRQQTHVAMGYVSLGVTGQGAKMLNDNRHRARKEHLPTMFNLARAMMWAAPSMLSFPPRFTIQLEGGKVQQVAEMQIVNGPIMGANGKYPVLLSDDLLHVGIVKPNDPLTVLFTALRMYLHIPPGARTPKPIHFSILSKDPVAAQVDGDYFTAAGNSAITITRSPLSLRVLATKPA
ncbi:MAG TPA: diacylglycerol kinase family protein [Patescibacteria group bacterium]|nr:diacylglycerol kinase family protein [Patescibacteria group bacterium]